MNASVFRSRSWGVRPLVAVSLSLAVAAACAKGTDSAADSAANAMQSGAPAGGSAAALIRSPMSGDTVGSDVTVALGAQGVTIAKADGQHVDGIGHFHLFLDTAPTPDSVVIPPTSANVVHIGTGDSTYTFKGLSAGPHELIVVIGYGDHMPMATRRDTIRFVVK